MHKHLILAVVYHRFIFHASIAHLNWPLTSRPEVMLHVYAYRATNSRIFHLSYMNGCDFLFSADAFCTIYYISKPLLNVLCARLLKLVIAFRDIFVLRLNFPGNKLHRVLTVSSYDVVFHEDALPRVVLCEEAASNPYWSYVMEHTFGIESSAGCTTNVVASEVYALDENVRAVQDDLHQQLINFRQKL